MKGYYDRGVMSHPQRLEFNPKRLDHLIIYGELVPTGWQPALPPGAPSGKS